jgi:hypothetical protein
VSSGKSFVFLTLEKKIKKKLPFLISDGFLQLNKPKERYTTVYIYILLIFFFFFNSHSISFVFGLQTYVKLGRGNTLTGCEIAEWSWKHNVLFLFLLLFFFLQNFCVPRHLTKTHTQTTHKHRQIETIKSNTELIESPQSPLCRLPEKRSTELETAPEICNEGQYSC